MAKAKVKIDPKIAMAADPLANAPKEGRDVAAEQQRKAEELTMLTDQERQEVLEQRAKNEAERLQEQAEADRNRAQRDKELKTLEGKPLSAAECERLAHLERLARGEYPKNRPHPPLGMLPTQIMKELMVLRIRAKIK